MKLASEIKELIASQGTKIKSHASVAFVTAVAEASPWFITGGGLNIPDWEQVKVDLQKILRKKGTDKVLLATFSIWYLIKDALLTDKVKVKEQLVEAEQPLEKIQEEEVRKSVSATDTQSEDKEESQFETKAQKVKVKEFSFRSSSESDSKERLEQEIVDLKRKLKKCKMKARTVGASAPSPPPYNYDWIAVGECQGVCFTLPQQAFPVMEMDDPNNPGQRIRYHPALTIKELRGLKEAVAAYGALAPFTLTMMESYQVSNLTPGEWQQLPRDALTGGDYLLWKGEFFEQCSQTACMNAQAGFPQRTLDMLFGQGQYATIAIATQINYDPAVYAQIGAAAVQAWKALPNKAAGDKLSKAVQSSSEPYSEFDSCLMQLVGKIFGDADTAMPVIKQLAFENANKYCKEALRAHKDKSLNDMIRLCRDIDRNHITGQVLAAAI
ncbi:hypothetical protein STEG23_011485 [Scotinomys teguina]